MSENKESVPALNGPRLPYHPAVEERFGIDRASWKALVEAVFPAAQSTESVILALSYCRARQLDPFKKNVHIVPIWDKEKRRLVDTVWPGIGELRTTAFRTGQYAGRDKTEFGPDITQNWTDAQGKKVTVSFPEWAQVTVYRMMDGQRMAFAGPQVYWMETFAEQKGGVPNAMWQKRPRGQLDKCAEGAALRAAFPEELGDQHTDAEAGLVHQHGSGARGGVTIDHDSAPPRPSKAQYTEEEPTTAALEDPAAQFQQHMESEGPVCAPQGEEPPPHDPETGEIVDNEAPPPETQEEPPMKAQKGKTQASLLPAVYDEEGEKIQTYQDARSYEMALAEAVSKSPDPTAMVQMNYETAVAAGGEALGDKLSMWAQKANDGGA